LNRLSIFIEDPELRQATTKAAMYWLDQKAIKSWCITENKSKANIIVKFFPANPRAVKAFIRLDFTIEYNKYYKPETRVMIHELQHAIFLTGD
jgi:hypothetical protein